MFNGVAYKFGRLDAPRCKVKNMIKGTAVKGLNVYGQSETPLNV